MKLIENNVLDTAAPFTGLVNALKTHENCFIESILDALAYTLIFVFVLKCTSVFIVFFLDLNISCSHPNVSIKGCLSSLKKAPS